MEFILQGVLKIKLYDICRVFQFSVWYNVDVKIWL